MEVIKKLSVLPREFYERETIEVAKDLLGKHVVRVKGNSLIVCKIVEVEAYRGRDDPASHAFRGVTKRNSLMFGDPGHAYIYFTYGNHYCLNVTTQPKGIPGAVLIRAVEPVEGTFYMKENRPNVSDLELSNGPGKLTKALRIENSLNEIDLTKPGPLFIVNSRYERVKMVRATRVGIRDGADRMWRFYIADNPYVSRA